MGCQQIQSSFSVPGRGNITVDFSIQVDNNPSEQGLELLFPNISSEAFSGFPLCKGVVHTASNGYASIYGWTQLWKQNESEWQFDWAPVQTGLNFPFVWFGPSPQLFDGPTRTDLTELDWTARSFLTYIEDSLMTKSVRRVVGFEWGFWIRNGNVEVKSLKQLEALDWDQHTEYLSTTFPGWVFQSS